MFQITKHTHIHILTSKIHIQTTNYRILDNSNNILDNKMNDEQYLRQPNIIIMRQLFQRRKNYAPWPLIASYSSSISVSTKRRKETFLRRLLGRYNLNKSRIFRALERVQQFPTACWIRKDLLLAVAVVCVTQKILRWYNSKHAINT